MKKLLMFFSLILSFYASSYTQQCPSEQLSLGIFGGIKLPEEENNIDSGPWLGININIPTGLGWSIQPEYNFWKTNYDSRIVGKDLFLSEWSLLVSYKMYMDVFFIQALAGPGIVSSGNTWFGGDRDFLVSFNATLKTGFKIMNETDVFLLLKKQWSGSLSTGGGPSYSPYLIGLGFQYRIIS
jgi:hypothetical protein